MPIESRSRAFQRAVKQCQCQCGIRS